MRKVTIAFGLLLVAVATWAQSETPPRTTIRSLTLSDVKQISEAERRQIAHEVSSHKDDSLADMSERVHYAFQERGFFKAWALPPTIAVVTGNAAEEIIDVTFDVHEGQRYRLNRITLGNEHAPNGYAFPESQLRQTFLISDGEIFDVEKIRRGLELLRELYVSRGYINFTPVPVTEADDRTGTVALRIDLDEGFIFRVGSLTLDGVEHMPSAGTHLLDAWKKYDGRVYDNRMMDDFIRENAAYLPPHAAGGHLFEVRQDAVRHVLNFRLDLGN